MAGGGISRDCINVLKPGPQICFSSLDTWFTSYSILTYVPFPANAWFDRIEIASYAAIPFAASFISTAIAFFMIPQSKSPYFLFSSPAQNDWCASFLCRELNAFSLKWWGLDDEQGGMGCFARCGGVHALVRTMQAPVPANHSQWPVDRFFFSWRVLCVI